LLKYNEQDNIKVAVFSYLKQENENQKIRLIYSKEDLQILTKSKKCEYISMNNILYINQRKYISKKLKKKFINEFHIESIKEHSKMNKT
jgi:hypothetical protein